MVIRMGDIGDGFPDKLGTRIADHVAELLVDIDEHPVEINARDPDRRIFEHGAIAFFVKPGFGHVVDDANEVLGRAVGAPRD